MAKRKAKNTFEQYLNELNFVKKPPNEAFLPYSVFAQRAGTSASVVKSAFMAGTIRHENCVTTLAKNNAQVKLLINWNTEAYQFIVNRDQKHWPGDFKKNKNKTYKPIRVSSEYSKPQRKRSAKKALAQALVDIKELDSIQEAKLEHEKLKIQETLIANQIANNEVLKVDDVVQIVQGIAFAVKSQLRRFITLVSPELLRCNRVVEIRSVLEEHIAAPLAELEPMLIKETYTQESEEKEMTSD